MMLEHHPDPNFSHTTGGIGVSEFQREMYKRKVISYAIPFTYDVILPRNRYAVEVKTAHRSINGTKKGTVSYSHTWSFTKSQMREGAYDYAVCYGLDYNDEVDVVYTIPQKYILHRLKDCETNKLTIPLNPDRPETIKRKERFKPCLNNLDMFAYDNRGTYTRYMNKLTRELMQYKSKLTNNIQEEILRRWNKGQTRSKIMEELNLTYHIVSNHIKTLHEEGKIKMGLNNKNLKYVYPKGNVNRGPNKGKVITDKDITDRVRKLWRKGHTRQEMCALLGVGTRRMGKICRKMTLPVRNPYRTKSIGIGEK
tara:strand:- start:51 stop:980 length:930 start_codon:yes stop_codon:yes gene_type:complete